MTRTTSRLLAFALTLFLSIPAAFAAPVDQAGADALKPKVAATLAHFQGVLKASGATLLQDGNLLVEPAGTYYAITTPTLTIRRPGGIVRNVGMVAINAIPTDNPDIFKVAVALPTPMTDKDPSGKDAGSLSIGQQTMNGVWNMAAQNFTDLNASYKDIRIIDTINNTNITIASLANTIKLSRSTGNLWSGPSETSLAKVTYTSPAYDASIGSVLMKTVVDGLDMLASEKMETAVKKAGTGVPDMQQLLTDYLTGFANSADSSLAMGDIIYKTKTAVGAKSGTVKSINLSGIVSGMKSNAAKASWNLDANGITVDDANLARYTPTRIILKGNGDNLPLQALAKANGQPVPTSVFADAKAALNIENISIESPAYGLNAKGQLQGNKNAPLGSVGNMSMNVRGMDELLVFLNSPQGAQALGMPPIPPQFLAGLALIQMSGQPGNDAQGRTTRNYNLQLGEDGRIILNGADLSAIMQSMTGAGKAPAAAPVTPVQSKKLSF